MKGSLIIAEATLWKNIRNNRGNASILKGEIIPINFEKSIKTTSYGRMKPWHKICSLIKKNPPRKGVKS
jgi:hypothetical protein